MIRTGGCGGFLASVRDIGVTGQQQQARTVSEEEAVRGGAGGFFNSRGGGTNPLASAIAGEEGAGAERGGERGARSIFLQTGFFIGERE